MTRIKKGLDYFCFTTDTFHDLRIKRLRRLCRTNGLLVYFYLLNEAYRVEGYYVKVDDELIIDTAEYFYLSEEEVKHIIDICCKEKLFDTQTYATHGMLTSDFMQERYITACKKLRRTAKISDELLLTDMLAEEAAKSQKTEKKTPEKEQTAADGSQNVAQRDKVHPICPQREEKREEENRPLPSIPSPESGSGEAVTMDEGGGSSLSDEKEQILPCPNTPCPRGEGRNYTGMVEALQRLHIETKDINAILKMSNFGEVGDPAWRALYTIGCASPGTFKQPAKYIYSIIQKARAQKGGVPV